MYKIFFLYNERVCRVRFPPVNTPQLLGALDPALHEAANPASHAHDRNARASDHWLHYSQRSAQNPPFLERCHVKVIAFDRNIREFIATSDEFFTYARIIMQAEIHPDPVCSFQDS